uniref:RNA binding motif single stranded interacting n=1 Tax=Mesocestoides corti TaxID=53468 RepID=A0A5K3FBB5_MESCO
MRSFNACQNRCQLSQEIVKYNKCCQCNHVLFGALIEFTFVIFRLLFKYSSSSERVLCQTYKCLRTPLYNVKNAFVVIKKCNNFVSSE